MEGDYRKIRANANTRYDDPPVYRCSRIPLPAKFKGQAPKPSFAF